MRIALTLATAIVALLTLLPLGRFEAWWVRGLDFPRLQLAALAGAVLVAIVVALPRDAWSTYALAAVTAVCLVYQLWWILPYTPFHSVEVKRSERDDPSRTLRIMSANVLTPNRDAEALLELVREHDPDVLVTLESDAYWESKLDALEPDYPHALKRPLDNLYGMHLYSKLELRDARIDFLVEDDKPSMHALIRLRSGDEVRAHFLHPAPPAPSENPSSGERDAELLIVARSIAETDEPVIVAGDLNDVAWSETTRAFRRISGLLDPRRGRGMYNTFHANHWFLRFPLDHLFHSDHFTVKRLLRTGSYGSDHFALVAELVYQPRRRAEQEAPAPTREDVEMSEEKAEDEGVSPSEVPEPE